MNNATYLGSQGMSMAFKINGENGIKVYLPVSEYSESSEGEISEALRVACSGFLFGEPVTLN